MFNRNDVAKTIASLFVSATVGKATAKVITNNTNLDPDGIPVMVASGAVGTMAMNAAEPHTDAFVEKALAWYDAKKAQNLDAPQP